jgi:hypothetical protein
MLAEFLRQQADSCRRLARTTFDLTTAEKLRYMAAGLEAKAETLDDEDTPGVHMISGTGFSTNGSPGQNGV